MCTGLYWERFIRNKLPSAIFFHNNLSKLLTCLIITLLLSTKTIVCGIFFKQQSDVSKELRLSYFRVKLRSMDMLQPLYVMYQHNLKEMSCFHALHKLRKSFFLFSLFLLNPLFFSIGKKAKQTNKKAILLLVKYLWHSHRAQTINHASKNLVRKKQRNGETRKGSK